MAFLSRFIGRRTGVSTLLKWISGENWGLGWQNLAPRWRERFENMGKDDIAVEKRASAVGKLGFAVEERDSAVEGDLKTVGFPGIAVGERGLALEKAGSAVWENDSADEKNDAAVGSCRFSQSDQQG